MVILCPLLVVTWEFFLVLTLLPPLVLVNPRVERKSFFEFSTEIKTRQCVRTLEILQKCNLSSEYNDIPPIHRNFSRVPQLTWASLTPFTLIIYVETNGGGIPTDFPTFCRRGFCLLCLLKASRVCWSAQASSNSNCQRQLNLTSSLPLGNISNGDFLCLSGNCSRSEEKCSSVEGDEGMDVSEGSSPCPPSAWRGSHCYFTNSTLRSRLMEDGKLIEYSNRAQSGHPFYSLHISLILLIYIFHLI